ncbi:hypothetical protein NE237_030557 [Protea cynaroides]|uniref:Uncharacterized protein n=1 Tax=Protea cynaroides TaxID=273540 RepID=A0A9Q0GWE6_9MAGN|nr:hypothetical protein NE237_030557 [Protea cynaroides]
MGVDPLSLPSSSSVPPGPTSAPAGLPPFAPSWRVHALDSGLRNRAVAREIIHHAWLPADTQTLRPIPLELICGSNHYHRMLSTALERLRGVQATAQESERLLVATQTERDAAIIAKTEMEGQLKVADEKLLEAEERFLKAEELAQEVQLMQKVIRDKLTSSSSLDPPKTSSSAPASPEVAPSSLPAPPEVTALSLLAPPKVISPAPAPLAPSNTPDAASEDLLPSEGC